MLNKHRFPTIKIGLPGSVGHRTCLLEYIIPTGQLNNSEIIVFQTCYLNIAKRNLIFMAVSTLCATLYLQDVCICTCTVAVIYILSICLLAFEESELPQLSRSMWLILQVNFFPSKSVKKYQKKLSIAFPSPFPDYLTVSRTSLFLYTAQNFPFLE